MSSLGAQRMHSQKGKVTSVARAEGGWGRVEENEAIEVVEPERWAEGFWFIV